MIKGMVNDLCGKDLFKDIIDTLQTNLFSSEGNYSAAVNLVEDLYFTVIQPIALMLMIIYFLLALVDKMTSENFTWEQMGKQMCMFLASFYLINHGFEILELLFQLGLSLTNQINALVADSLDPKDAASRVESVINTFKETINVPNFLKDICLFVYLLIPWALSWIMGLVVKIICYTRVIEIYARAAFAPIALSDFFHSGFQGAGWRFLKSFLAVCLQGALILVINAIYSTLFDVIAGSVDTKLSLFAFLGVYLAVMASACMLMFKSLSLSKELLGVN